jgi:hypothetical protein
MNRLQAIVVLLVAASTGNRSASQEPGSVVADQRGALGSPAEAPMRVFSDKIRRFRFELDETLVTAETAEQFRLLHQSRNEPPIFGAYADCETNSLVVVAPPEAEHPVRETLARWMVERQPISPPSLDLQKRTLEFRRDELLREMAALEIQALEASVEKAEQLRDRVKSFETTLDIVEKQMDVVDRYIQRLHDRDATTVERPARNPGIATKTN